MLALCTARNDERSLADSEDRESASPPSLSWLSFETMLPWRYAQPTAQRQTRTGIYVAGGFAPLSIAGPDGAAASAAAGTTTTWPFGARA
jgi:hypothetical protein